MKFISLHFSWVSQWHLLVTSMTWPFLWDKYGAFGDFQCLLSKSFPDLTIAGWWSRRVHLHTFWAMDLNFILWSSSQHSWLTLMARCLKRLERHFDYCFQQMLHSMLYTSCTCLRTKRTTVKWQWGSEMKVRLPCRSKEASSSDSFWSISQSILLQVVPFWSYPRILPCLQQMASIHLVPCMLHQYPFLTYLSILYTDKFQSDMQWIAECEDIHNVI